MYCVYIIYSESIDGYYIGETSNIEKRLEQHNSGFFDKAYTKIANDWSLFVKIDCDNRKQAKSIEKHIKQMKSKKYLQNLKLYSEISTKLKTKYK